MRTFGVEDIEWSLQDCLMLKKEFPDVICGTKTLKCLTARSLFPAGYDLVGAEDNGRPLIDFIEPLLRFESMQREAGVEIPFIFHAGECLGDGNSTDSNLYDAILLGTKRIGHG